MPVPVPLRGSTFVREEPDNKKKSRSLSNGNKFDMPARSNTFTIDDIDKQSPIRSSLRLSANPVMEKKSNSPQVPLKPVRKSLDKKSPMRSSMRFTANLDMQKKSTPPQITLKPVGKSIGKKIMTASIQRGTFKTEKNKPGGSSVKKTITKSTPKSPYRNKFGVAKTLPNFKSIHQKLFSNMESLGDNQKRKVERAQALLQSPAVPRCAIVSPRVVLPKEANTPKVKTPLRLSASAANTMTPVNVLTRAKTPGTVTSMKTKTPGTVSSMKGKTPGTVSSMKTKTPATVISMKTKTSATVTSVTTKTPGTVTKPTATIVNRFGFKPRVNKSEANDIVGKKLPPVSVGKKKEQDRKFLQGVRTNKRFLLQMQMRQLNQ